MAAAAAAAALFAGDGEDKVSGEEWGRRRQERIGGQYVRSLPNQIIFCDCFALATNFG